MGKWVVRVWCMTASYYVSVDAKDADEAIQNAKKKAMPDMQHWHYTLCERKQGEDNESEKN